jgi:hypothetical protein
MFNDYPRKMGFPEQLTVYSEEHMLNLVNQANGKMNIYTSVFSDNQKLFGNLDKVVFDIDDCTGICSECNPSKHKKCSIGAVECNPETYDSFSNMLILHEHFLENNIRHCIGFSGGGYHIYAAVVAVSLSNPNPAIKNFSFKLTKQLNIKCDTSVFELERIIRFPGTFNIKRQKWFVWITQQDITKGDEWIRVKANNQYIEPPFLWGDKRLDLRSFDSPAMDKIGNFQRKLDADSVGIEINDVKIPPCIQALLDDPWMNYKDRYHCYLFFKEKGINMQGAIKIMQGVLSPEKFYHSVMEERQPLHIYKNNNLFFPKCRIMERDGYCVKPDCEYKDSIYL